MMEHKMTLIKEDEEDNDYDQEESDLVVPEYQMQEEKETKIDQSPEEPSITEKVGYYIAPKIYHVLQKSIRKVKEGNLDRVYVIDGREGEGGKSTLAMQLANICDPNFNLSKIVFNALDFEKVLRSAEKGDAIIFDEAFNGLSSKSALSKQNKRLVRLLMEVRQRNLFIFIVLPSIFLLEKYVAVFRSQCLFHAYCSKKSYKNRYYKVYNYHKKKLLFIKGKNLMSYTFPKVPLSYRFYAKIPKCINYEEYIQKKLKAFRDEDGEKEVVEDKHALHKNHLIRLIVKNGWMSQAELSRDPELGLCNQRISQIVHTGREIPSS